MTNAGDEPRVVAAGRGAGWWADGLSLFRSGFWTWLGIMVIYLIITMLISMVPYVGSIGHWLLTPVFMGGLMLGCRALERGEPLRVAHLFEGFQGAHFVPLMIIGAVNIAITLGIGTLAVVGVAGSLKIADLASIGSARDPLDALMGSASGLGGTGLLVSLLILVIATVFAMLNWFAPALVALQGANAVDAMKRSFVSCLRNWVPFLVYGLIAIGVMIAAAVAFGGIALAFGAGALFSGGNSGSWIAMAAVLFVLFMLAVAVVALFVGPIVFGSTYAGYKDTLADDGVAPADPAFR
ncbi:MAG: BPSS1780 family membrane protein [Burkholderiales bacterium]